jgi:hypothetical protein
VRLVGVLARKGLGLGGTKGIDTEDEAGLKAESGKNGQTGRRAGTEASVEEAVAEEKWM